MRKITEVIIPLLACGMLAGCMSPGGAVIVGPFSAISAKHIDKAKMARSVAMSPRIPQADKPAVISAVNMAMSPGEIAVGYKVDVLALFSSDYTWGEVGIQALTATADLAAEAAAGIALYNTMTKDSHDSTTTTITGNGNVVNNNSTTGYIQPQNGNDNVGGDVNSK